INRKRFWKSTDEVDQMNAYWCLYQAIKATIGIMAPITPFITDYIYQNTVREVEKDAPISIHLTSYPTPLDIPEEENILAETEVSRQIIATAQRMRNEAQIKVKQPLSRLYVTASEEIKSQAEVLSATIKEELNVKELLFTPDTKVYNDVYYTVNFRVAGAALKGEAQKLKGIVDGLDQAGYDALDAMVKADNVNIGQFEGLKGNLFDAHNRPKQGYLVTTENGVTLALDTTLNEELVAEGLVRELVRQIQVLRKDAGFAVEQRIVAEITTESAVAKAAIDKFSDKIQADILAREFNTIIDAEAEKEFNIQDSVIVVKLKR
ncbi:MAG: class I tRNA ligase family protein, partial [Clostridia bacterium]|nr:class I tRNA ligase family protein [Clostridia bacterium]